MHTNPPVHRMSAAAVRARPAPTSAVTEAADLEGDEDDDLPDDILEDEPDDPPDHPGVLAGLRAPSPRAPEETFRVSTRLPFDMVLRLTNRAATTRRPMGELIRIAVTTYLGPARR